MHRRRQNKVKSYFEITEDPPQPLPALRNTNRAFNNYKLPVNKGFFFIDFTEGCQLRLLEKRKIEDYGEPLELQRFGQNVIINVQDSSQQEDRLVKYEEQHRSIRDKKIAIEGKLKQTLDKDKSKFRSKSLLAIRQQLISDPHFIKLTRKQSIETSLPTIDNKSPRKVELALRKLGLVRE